MSLKAKFMALAALYGIEVDYRAGGVSRASSFHGKEPYPAEIRLGAPKGKILCSSGCHSDYSLCHRLEEDGTKTNWNRAYAGLQAIVAQGFEDCSDRPDCDICDEPENGW